MHEVRLVFSGDFKARTSMCTHSLSNPEPFAIGPAKRSSRRSRWIPPSFYQSNTARTFQSLIKVPGYYHGTTVYAEFPRKVYL